MITKNLDPLIELTPENGTITLTDGIWTTKAVGTENSTEDVKRELKLGVTLEGPKAGEGIATIISVRPMTEAGGDASVIRGAGRNKVKNVTVDGGVPAPEDIPQATPYPGKRNLVFLKGDGNVIENVIGRRQYGILGTGQESFGLSAWGSEAAPSRITNCQIVDVIGNYATAMRAEQITQSIVNFPRPRKGVKAFRAAFNMGDTVNGMVQDCEAWWAHAAVYTDWKSCVGLIAQDNAFYGCDAGLYVNAQQEADPKENRINSNITFRRNQVWLNPKTEHVNGILLDHSTHNSAPLETTWHAINGVKISENVIGFLPGETVETKHAYAANVCDFTSAAKRSATLGITGVEFENNTVCEEPTMKWRTKGSPELGGFLTKPIPWEEI